MIQKFLDFNKCPDFLKSILLGCISAFVACCSLFVLTLSLKACQAADFKIKVGELNFEVASIKDSLYKQASVLESMCKKELHHKVELMEGVPSQHLKNSMVEPLEIENIKKQILEIKPLSYD
jgi:hypothetical protein